MSLAPARKSAKQLNQSWCEIPKSMVHRPYPDAANISAGPRARMRPSRGTMSTLVTTAPAAMAELNSPYPCAPTRSTSCA